MSIQQDNEALVGRAMNAFLQGRGEEFFSLFDEESVLIEPAGLPYAGSYKGPEAIMGALQHMSSCWQDWEVKPRQMTSGGEYVIVLIDFSATGVATGQRAGRGESDSRVSGTLL